ncbi:RecQ family ATP-dependent DNA helicase [Lignipirellula cremea]|uniref:ATP-dependent DNA helicase RecQ n=1 Tax=Lignipirellula cremea TaxID=2528010 RepID=A0A518DUR6_9BACT|nr:RecQ family ATP-dependent DNA helicase [Lignipirellula cremea]QDU95568.1 ATP-dependent DNA helicase RecQ [Lignipirellula cremea]
MDLEQVLLDQFGHSQFMPGQKKTISALMGGHSAAAVFPTGGGKSLCYQLPAVLLPGLTVVVSPLIALMKDQIDALKRRGVAAQKIDSTLTSGEYQQTMQDLRSGALKLLYAAPERFANERFRETLLQHKISLFAVDEAHCISEWGHNFRPDYLKLAGFAAQCKAERILALTATATPAVLNDMCRVFQIAPENAVCTGFYRPNLTLLAESVSGAGRDTLLLQKLRERPVGPTIVYVTLQRTAMEVASRLQRAGLPAKAYHAGMDTADRTQVQEWFMESDDAIVAATIAFGMGVDKANIRYVYHYNLPKSLENYSQEIGRAGRDGNPSVCDVLACADDLNTLENFVYGDTPSGTAIDGLIRSIFAQPEDFDVSLYELARDHDLKQIIVRTLLTYLELDGYLEGGTPVVTLFKFQPHVPSKKMLEGFDADRQTFLQNLFRQAKKGKTWFTLDVAAAAEKLQQPREKLIRTLDYLAEKGLMTVKTEGVRLRFRRLKSPDSLADLIEDLHHRMTDFEDREIERLQQVVEFIEAEDCRTNRLCEHFGEERREGCGHCSVCLDQAPVRLPDRDAGSIPESLAGRLGALPPDSKRILKEPVTLSRFLCGVTSPAFTKAKLSSNELFGVLSSTPYPRIREFAEQLLQRKRGSSGPA